MMTPVANEQYPNSVTTSKQISQLCLHDIAYQTIAIS
jgi:hypothetical protein